MLFIGASMAAAQYIVVIHGFWALGGLSGGLVGLALSLLLFRLPRYRGSAAQRAAANSQPTTIPLWLALMPYAILTLIIIGGRLAVPIKTLLGQVVVRVQFPELATSQGWVTPAETGRTIDVFGHAGALLLYTSVVSYLLLRWKGHYQPGAVKRIAQRTIRRSVRSSIGIATMVGMVVVMQHAGMTWALAEGVADAVGDAFPWASPFIGALGAFMTGSNTNSNVVFGSFQQDAATIWG
jgi:lactate permease